MSKTFEQKSDWITRYTLPILVYGPRGYSISEHLEKDFHKTWAHLRDLLYQNEFAHNVRRFEMTSTFDNRRNTYTGFCRLFIGGIWKDGFLSHNEEGTWFVNDEVELQLSKVRFESCWNRAMNYIHSCRVWATYANNFCAVNI